MLFSAEMVNAILDGSKTQTRRTQGILVNDEPNNWTLNPDFAEDGMFIFRNSDNTQGYFPVPRFDKGDIIWVRETFFPKEIHEEPPGTIAHYKATDAFASNKWKPSIFMPKKACRLFLKVKNVKIERLQQISEIDAISEGCAKYGPFGEYKGSLHPNGGMMRYRAYSKASRAFQCIWETVNGSVSWNKNPFVWVIEFERIDKPKDF